jgi:hypothetical protein
MALYSGLCGRKRSSKKVDRGQNKQSTYAGYPAHVDCLLNKRKSYLRSITFRRSFCMGFRSFASPKEQIQIEE